MAAETECPKEPSAEQKCPRVQLRHGEPLQEGGAGKMSPCKHGKLVRQVTHVRNGASDMNGNYFSIVTETKHERLSKYFCVL